MTHTRADERAIVVGKGKTAQPDSDHVSGLKSAFPMVVTMAERGDKIPLRR
jgi:hypothetical protein